MIREAAPISADPAPQSLEPPNETPSSESQEQPPDVFATLAFGGALESRGQTASSDVLSSGHVMLGPLPEVLAALLAQSRFADALACRKAMNAPEVPPNQQWRSTSASRPARTLQDMRASISRVCVRDVPMKQQGVLHRFLAYFTPEKFSLGLEEKEDGSFNFSAVPSLEDVAGALCMHARAATFCDLVCALNDPSEASLMLQDIVGGADAGGATMLLSKWESLLAHCDNEFKKCAALLSELQGASEGVLAGCGGAESVTRLAKFQDYAKRVIEMWNVVVQSLQTGLLGGGVEGGSTGALAARRVLVQRSATVESWGQARDAMARVGLGALVKERAVEDGVRQMLCAWRSDQVGGGGGSARARVCALSLRELGAGDAVVHYRGREYVPGCINCYLASQAV